MIIDTDTHFTEPPDLWTTRLPSKWGDDVMHVVWDDKRQAEVWTVGEAVLGGAWSLLSYATKVADSEETRPKTRDDVHPATWDQAERVKVMDALGIRTALLYPNFAGLHPTRFRGAFASNEIAEAHIRVYNDYQVEWAANYPGRFIPMLVVPFWDLPAAVKEIERMAGHGFGGIVTTGAPHVHSQPYLADTHWDPMWQACVDQGLSVSYHIGNAGLSDFSSPELEALMPPATNLGYQAVPLMLENGKQVLDLLLSGVLARFPALDFVSVESALGWVPFVLEAADYHFKKARKNFASHPWGDLLPSDLFHRQVYVNYWFEHLQQWQIDAIGEDRILFETDFPHRTCLEEADVKYAIGTLMSEISEEVREKILWRNASKLYHLADSAEG
jgi:predicted TIM-barrel fold metal-dependent hydrolase